MMSLVSPLRGRLVATVIAIGVILGLGAVTLAHPTASSFVVIQAPTPTRVTVTITTEASPLLMKLDAQAGRVAGPNDARPAEVDRRIRELAHVLLGQVELRLDDRPAPLEFQSLERVAARPEQIRVVLIGQVPDSTGHLRWRTSLFFGSYPLAVRAAGIDPESPSDTDSYEWLSGPDMSQPYSMSSLSSPESGWAKMAGLIVIGFMHILPGGLDHVLFVLGLFLLAANARALLLQISAFTIAHSVTLALAVTGWVSVPAHIVEPLIALSIFYVAVENLFATSISRSRLAVVFVFGLLHGLGFAEALGALGLSQGHLAITLVGFNIGVELGQLAVVAAAALFIRALPVTPEVCRQLITRPASAAIAAAGLFWAVQRVM